MYIMPSTPLTCSSIGAATVSRTVCALAPGIERGHLHRRRRHFRVLGDRQREHGDAARQRDDDGDHRGENRPIDEKARHTRTLARSSISERTAACVSRLARQCSCQYRQARSRPTLPARATIRKRSHDIELPQQRIRRRAPASSPSRYRNRPLRNSAGEDSRFAEPWIT